MFIIQIEDLPPDSPDGNVNITIQRIARPDEPVESPAMQLTRFLEKAIELYLKNEGCELKKDDVKSQYVQPWGKPCLH